MSRTVFFALIAVVVAGCAGNAPVPTNDDEMIMIPAGTFTMGDSAGRPDETPHVVSISAFSIDKHPVTQELYEKVMGVNPSKCKEPKNPVERTQWTDAVRFCNKCSERDGLT